MNIVINFVLGLLCIVFIIGLLWFGCFAIGHITHGIVNYFELDFWLPSVIETGFIILFTFCILVCLCISLFYLVKGLSQCF